MIEEVDLLNRIARLERENRRVKIAVFAVVLSAAAIFSWMRFDSGRRLVVKELVVTDDAGNIVAQLGTAQQRTCLHLESNAKLTKAEFCADQQYGAFVNLASRNPAGRAYLGAGERVREGGGDRMPGLFIEGEAGKGMLSFDVGTETELIFGRGMEDNAIMLSAGSDRPKLALWNNEGKVLWTTPTTSP